MPAKAEIRKPVQGGKSITVRGIVVPVEWDKKGTVIAAALLTHNEEEYLIRIMTREGK